MPDKLVPDDFVVPERLDNERFLLRKLTVDDAEKDYDAVVSSIGHLTGVFGPGSDWPRGITLEYDIEDLRWHQEEFERRSSFAYTVMSTDEERCLGCVYIFPSRKEGFEADVLLWVREDELSSGLDGLLFSTVKKWIRERWPFKRVAYPGRDIDWKAWETFSDSRSLPYVDR